MSMDPPRAEAGMGRFTRNVLAACSDGSLTQSCGPNTWCSLLRACIHCRFFRSAATPRTRGKNVRSSRRSWHNAHHQLGQVIRFVLDTLTLRGPPWARACMDRVEGFDLWPHHVQTAVQAAEREALEEVRATVFIMNTVANLSFTILT